MSIESLHGLDLDKRLMETNQTSALKNAIEQNNSTKVEQILGNLGYTQSSAQAMRKTFLKNGLPLS
ncbi:MAG: hypothetical protein OEZ58_12735 [Gammaproteobacteria bacterium]|nr:hypothetical protein [Gammaproteobacteria bacterium]MDH5729853.1 hypothetical protein [Gammaproteobacteria bacterium]